MHEKEQLVGQIQKYFSSCPNNIRWNVLVDPNNMFFDNPEYRHNWFLIRTEIISAKNNIAQEVLKLPIFSPNPFWQSTASTYEIKGNLISELRC
jgi:hypothetical protein